MKEETEPGEEEVEDIIKLKIIDERRIEQNEEPEIRNRFKSSSGTEGTNQPTGDGSVSWADIYNTDKREEDEEKAWTEKDPETTQIFKRAQQNASMFSVVWGGGDKPDVISREEAWKIYIKKLQEEANYLLPSPDKEEICCCNECIMEYELQCNEVLGWRKRAPTVEGFSQEVNKLCDPSAPEVFSTIVQEKYRSLPCSIM